MSKWATVSVVATKLCSLQSGGSIVRTKKPGVMVGDLMLYVVNAVCGVPTNIIPPAGWIELGTANPGWGWKIANAGDVASSVFKSRPRNGGRFHRKEKKR